MRSRLFAFFIILIFTFLFLEGATCILVKVGLLLHEAPTYSWKNVTSRFWVENNPVYGVWHLPYSSYLHRRGCFEVPYHANRYGMRDPERKMKGNPHRTVVLGDSFVEGFGIPIGERFTDLLEKQMGREYLNFGTGGYFGPTQYYLLYRELASKFSHDEVMIGIYPNNDFTDDDLTIWKGSGKYRPFWVGKYPDYKLVYSSDKPRGLSNGPLFYAKGLLREYTYTFNLFEYLKGLVAFKLKELSHKKSHGNQAFSAYYDFSEAQWDRMRFSLNKIREVADGKRIIVLLFPSPEDIRRYQPPGPTPLRRRMEEWAKPKNIQVIDLMDAFLAEGEGWKKFYHFPCDKHFSPKGDAKVAQFIAKKLNQRNHGSF